jgi:hypothetical protein
MRLASPTDPDSKIAKMKDGPTHLAKVTRGLILKTELVLAAGAHPAGAQPDSRHLAGKCGRGSGPPDGGREGRVTLAERAACQRQPSPS